MRQSLNHEEVLLTEACGFEPRVFALRVVRLEYCPTQRQLWVHPILFDQTRCRWSKAEANASFAANAAWNTTTGRKSSIGGIAAPQSLNQKNGMHPCICMHQCCDTPRSCLKIKGGGFAASSSVKICKNATVSGWRNSVSCFSTVMMTSAARVRMRCARRSRILVSRSWMPHAEPEKSRLQLSEHRTRATLESAEPSQPKKTGMHPRAICGAFVCGRSLRQGCPCLPQGQ